MAIYSEQFKLGVVQQYLAGPGGIKAVAMAHGVTRAMVQRWVAAYRHHGAAGLAAKRGGYSASFKLKVLRRMWRDRLSYRQAAALFDVRGEGVIGKWERRYHAEGKDGLMSRRRGKPPAMAIPKPPKLDLKVPDANRSQKELLAELEYLRAENAYLKKLDALIQEKKAAQKKRS
jgi:transposase